MRSVLKKVGYLAIVAMGGLYVYLAMNGPHGIPALLEKRRQIRAMQEENADLKREIQQKRERIDRLRDNPEEQEMEIRRRLKLQKPEEMDFYLPDAPKPAK
jgi:cell division protein FtsB